MTATDFVGHVQSGLNRAGFDAGPVDRLPGPRTLNAFAAAVAAAMQTRAADETSIPDWVDDRSARNIRTLGLRAQAMAVAHMGRVIEALRNRSETVRIISGTRTYEQQDALYAKGRTAPGPKVTNARGGYSNHNFGVAWDIGVFDGGRYLDESEIYDLAGRIGVEMGLEWGGDWKSFKDKPHFQMRTGLTLAEMRKLKAGGREIG